MWCSTTTCNITLNYITSHSAALHRAVACIHLHGQAGMSPHRPSPLRARAAPGPRPPPPPPPPGWRCATRPPRPRTPLWAGAAAPAACARASAGGGGLRPRHRRGCRPRGGVLCTQAAGALRDTAPQQAASRDIAPHCATRMFTKLRYSSPPICRYTTTHHIPTPTFTLRPITINLCHRRVSMLIILCHTTPSYVKLHPAMRYIIISSYAGVFPIGPYYIIVRPIKPCCSMGCRS